MITRISEWKTLIKQASCNCKCKFDGRKCNTKQKWNNNKYQYQFKRSTKHSVCKEDYAWNPRICACECDKDCEIEEYLKYCQKK